MKVSEGWPPSLDPLREPLPNSVAIVLPMRDGLKFAKLAIYSVLYFTDHPYSFTIVDNMSSFPTAKYLRSLAVNHQIDVLRYGEEFNFAAEVNLGLRHAFKSPNVKYGLILNSDAVVEPSWLSRLLEPFAVPEVGIVGPVSNAAMPVQVSFKTPEIFETDRISGFCMAFRREVFEQLGGFDESFVGGCYEDLDFCVRARKAGWKCIVNGSTYIHHFWKSSRRSHEHDLQTLANEKRFYAKHPAFKAETLDPEPVWEAHHNGR